MHASLFMSLSFHLLQLLPLFVLYFSTSFSLFSIFLLIAARIADVGPFVSLLCSLNGFPFCGVGAEHRSILLASLLEALFCQQVRLDVLTNAPSAPHLFFHSLILVPSFLGSARRSIGRMSSFVSHAFVAGSWPSPTPRLLSFPLNLVSSGCSVLITIGVILLVIIVIICLC